MQSASYILAREEEGNSSARGEVTVECTYRMAVTRWLIIQPDIQYVDHPDADRATSIATVFGTRLEFHL
jgi:carbohydrate-selective porin OprB